MFTGSREQSTGIVVLGMHRSGTSLTAHLLGELGCSFGGPLVEARADNPLGYWEHAAVVAAHNAFLTSLARRWDDPRALTDEHFASPEGRAARAEITAIFRRDFAPERLWVLKDPRHCVLLPLWADVFGDPGHHVHFLHVVRHPRAVADSLAKRDGLSLAQGLLLWLRHHLEAERGTRGRSRAWTAFEDMVADPRPSLEGACERLGVAGELAFASKPGVFDEVLDRSQVHHGGAGSEDPSLGELYPWVERSYRALSAMVAGGESAEALGELDRVAAEMQAAERIFHVGLVAKMEALLDDYAADRAELVEAADQAAAHARELEEALAVSQEYATALIAAVTEKDRELARLWEELQKRGAEPP